MIVKNFKISDELSETRPLDQNEYFQDAKMINVLRNNKDKSCEEFAKILYDELVEFRSCETFDDDVSFVCLDVK